jgi:hypothetical protein
VVSNARATFTNLQVPVFRLFSAASSALQCASAHPSPKTKARGGRAPQWRQESPTTCGTWRSCLRKPPQISSTWYSDGVLRPVTHRILTFDPSENSHSSLEVSRAPSCVNASSLGIRPFVATTKFLAWLMREILSSGLLAYPPYDLTTLTHRSPIVNNDGGRSSYSATSGKLWPAAALGL